MTLEEAVDNVLRGHQQGCCSLCGGHRMGLASARVAFAAVDPLSKLPREYLEELLYALTIADGVLRTEPASDLAARIEKLLAPDIPKWRTEPWGPES